MKAKIFKAQQGFTLIEVMVVVVILGILASTVIPKIMNNPDKARTIKAQQDIRAIESALNLYKLDNHRYPTTDQGLALLTKKANGQEGDSYLHRVPVDPWGEEYKYLSPGVDGQFNIFTFGADKKEGGNNADADIWNSKLN